ncbi:hypothetical protein SAMN05216378_0007 [Paenibacillus catalpae]|uniref:Uncharacterized protein n=1 Tax=Paenibacillus catalpae TaxID=1045775 RepID=A0A1I2HWF4_9BACL|nr:hypothetical protein SAMN05216378_0007 [Paenibacillus catalpae]
MESVFFEADAGNAGVFVLLIDIMMYNRRTKNEAS